MTTDIQSEQDKRGVPETWELRRLAPNPLNPRGAIVADAEVRGLADSIRLHGLLQPLVVTPDGVIVAGHRRFAACQLLGLESVAVTVRDFTEQEQSEVMLVENLQRRDLSPLQAARGFKVLHECGLSIETIAGRVGWGKDTVRKHLWILDLAPEVQAMYDSGELSVGFIPYLIEIESHERQTQVAQQAIDEEWLVNEMSSAVKIVAPQTVRGRRAFRTKRTRNEQILVNHAREAERAIKRLSAKCKDEHFDKRYYKAWLEDLADYLQDFEIQDRQVAAVEAWHKGCRTAKDFAQFLKLSVQEAEDLLSAMERERVFCEVKEGVKRTSRSRGDVANVWHLIGEPLGSDLHVVIRATDPVEQFAGSDDSAFA